MQFKKRAIPAPTPGKSFLGEKTIVVPDQSMSLEYILKKFTRQEPLPVGFDGQFDEEADLENPLHVDLEKLMLADLVDRAEYMDKLKEVSRRYESEEKERTKIRDIAARQKAEEEATFKKDVEEWKKSKSSSEKSAE